MTRGAASICFFVIILAGCASIAARDTAPELNRASMQSAVARAVPILQKSAAIWITEKSCTSCHHQSLGNLAMASARDAGAPVDNTLVRAQVDALKAGIERSLAKALEGAGSANGNITYPYLMLGIAAAGESATPGTDALVYYLRLRQTADGGWTSDSHRPPLEDARETATALSIRALQLYTPGAWREEVEARIARARKWLAAQTPREHEGRVFRLLGLVWSRAEKQRIGAAAEELLKLQKTAGGWSQLATLEPDAYATGYTVLALLAAGIEPEHPAIRRAIDFLQKTQLADGTWHVATRRRSEGLRYFETGFPHGEDQFISYAASALAVTAISSVLNGRLPDEFTRTDSLWTELSPRIHFSDDVQTQQFFEAVVYGDSADVADCLAHGADVNGLCVFGAPPLHYSVLDVEKLNLLIHAGAIVDARSEFGRRAVTLAALGGETEESLKTLLLHHADHNEPDNSPELTPLSAAILSNSLHHVAAVLRGGGRLAIKNPDTLPPLVAALMTGNAPLARELAVDNPQLNKKDEEGLSLFDEAILNRDVAMVEALLAAGADPNHAGGVENYTALHWAAMVPAEDDQIVRLLLKNGASRALVTKSGKTALDLARQYHNSAAVGALEER